MKRIFIVLLIVISLVAIFSSCIAPIEIREVGGKVVTNCYGNILPCATTTYNLGSPTARWENIYVENVITGGGGSIHAQNTDIILTTNGVQSLINAGRLVYDLKTDRWLLNDSNTFLGTFVAGAGNLAHGIGGEGWYNSALGSYALHNITTGYYNTAVGTNAGHSITTGKNNVFVGSDAGRSITTNDNSTAVGYLSQANATGAANTSLGDASLASASGSYNTAVGTQSLFANTGNYNTAVGVWAGGNNTGSSNVFLGYSAGQNSGAESNKLYIDNSNTATPLIHGDFSTNSLTVNGDLTVTGKLKATLIIYANNAAAVAGGLAVGTFYRTGGDPDLVCVVH